MTAPTPARFAGAVPPRAGLDVYKAHGLGNDYLVVERGDAWDLDGDAVRRVCHRTLGAGSDGIIWVDPDTTPFALRMFNPDGSEFERSGNGLRILASHLHRTGRVGGEPFRVTVGGAEVEMQVLDVRDDGYDIVADMGAARVGPDAVALDPSAVEVGARAAEARFGLDGAVVTLVPVSVGNPHAVVWGDPDAWSWAAIDAAAAVADLERLGPALTAHPAFAEGTNVQLARVASPSRLEALVWERGAGRTSASGTSACAVAVAAVTTGRIPAGEIEVVMEGGRLRVRVTPELGVRLRGPVEAVMSGRLTSGLVAG
ncbi:MAG TPA: diaminopimelate epimerase [Longimicrobiales bacterium]|nr:diaminopimelate epimerase [Longimicrobiales bacterium]